MKLQNKNRIAVFLMVFGLFLMMLSPLSAQSTPTGNIFTFEPLKTGYAISSTNNTDSLCAVVTGILVNTTQSVSPTTVIKFRYDTGFGTLNTASGLRVAHYNRTSAASTPVSTSDFSITSTANNAIVIAYTPLTTKEFAFRDSICVDPDWDAPSTSTEGIVDLSVTLNSINTSTQEKMFFVR